VRQIVVRVTPTSRKKDKKALQGNPAKKRGPLEP